METAGSPRYLPIMVLFALFADAPLMQPQVKETASVLWVLLHFMPVVGAVGAAIILIGLWQSRKKIRTPPNSN
jgi:hypothetical protein